jgi:hypothetical protein
MQGVRGMQSLLVATTSKMELCTLSVIMVYKARRGLTGDNRLRDTGTRLIDCPFSVRANLKHGTWTVKVRNPDHNHEATSNSLSHPIQRRMPDCVKKQVEALFTAGTKPQQIMSAVQQTWDYTVISRDVYKAHATLRLKNLAGRSPMEALITMLEGRMFTFNYRMDAISRVTHLFFAHSGSIKLLKMYPDVLLLDCTY